MGQKLKTRDEIRELPDDAFLLAGEVGLLFRVDPKTVARWAAANKIPHIRTIGGHTRYHHGTMKALLSGGQQPS